MRGCEHPAQGGGGDPGVSRLGPGRDRGPQSCGQSCPGRPALSRVRSRPGPGVRSECGSELSLSDRYQIPEVKRGETETTWAGRLTQLLGPLIHRLLHTAQ